MDVMEFKNSHHHLDMLYYSYFGIYWPSIFDEKMFIGMERSVGILRRPINV